MFADIFSNAESLRALLIGLGSGVLITFVFGMIVHFVKKAGRKKVQAQREDIAKQVAQHVGTVNNLFFTFRLGDSEFGVMERECREILGHIDQDIQSNKDVLDDGYIQLLGYFAEDKREQLVHIRHDLEMKNHQSITNLAHQAQGATTQIPQQPVAAAPAAPQEIIAPMPPAPNPLQEGFAAAPAAATVSSDDSDEGSMSFSDFATAMQDGPSNGPGLLGSDDPSSASDSWTIPSTMGPQDSVPTPTPTPAPSPAPSPFMEPAAPITPQSQPVMGAAQIPVPIEDVAPSPVQTTVIPSQPIAPPKSRDVEATQEFTLNDIMQQAEQTNAPAQETGGAPSGDDVANAFDNLFG